MKTIYKILDIKKANLFGLAIKRNIAFKKPMTSKKVMGLGAM